MRRVLFWLAIGMFGIIVPAAEADTMRFANCLRYDSSIAIYDEANCAGPRSMQVYGCSVVSFSCNGRCKIALGALHSCGTAVAYSADQAITSKGISNLDYLISTLRTMDDPEQEWRYEWPIDCTCDAQGMYDLLLR